MIKIIKYIGLVVILIFLSACSEKQHKFKSVKITKHKQTVYNFTKKIVYQATSSAKRKSITNIYIGKDNKKYYFKFGKSKSNYQYRNFNDKMLNSSYRTCSYSYGKISPNKNFIISSKSGNDSIFGGKLNGSLRLRHSLWYSPLNITECTNANVKKYYKSFGNEGIETFDISPDNKYIATVNYKNNLLINYYEIETGKIINTIKVQDNYDVLFVQFTPNGKGLFVVQNSSINPIKLYDIVSDKKFNIKTPIMKNSHKGYLPFVKMISKDGNIIISIQSQNLVITNLQKQQIKLFGNLLPSSIIQAIDISYDNSFMLVSTNNNKLYIIDLKTYKAKILSNDYLVTSIKISKDKKFFLLGRGKGGIIEKWAFN